MDRLRQDVAALAGDTEWSILYPGDHKSVSGSASPHDTTRPSIILFWVTLSLRKIMDHNATEAPIMNGLLTQLAAVGSCFWNMDKIDKTQFPFPYCQVVKWLTLVFLGILPFSLAAVCGWWTLLFSAIAAIGFFGLDEVAEILESPFGNDPNDLDLREYCDALMSDMELICQCRELKLDFVLKENEKVDFSHLLANFDKQKQFHQHFKRQSVALAQSGEFSRAQSDGFSRDSQSQEEAELASSQPVVQSQQPILSFVFLLWSLPVASLATVMLQYASVTAVIAVPAAALSAETSQASRLPSIVCS
ncbi:unnamed protein product [Symbiodinium microadriaticum]|nr:unnamed protein product [Symbiodinium microadriaticum]